MQAEYRDDGVIVVSGTVRAERFNRMWAGIGWPESDPGYLCVVGERTDGRYHALWEARGGLWEIGDAAVQAKDRFLLDRIVIDASDELASSYIRTVDGLSRCDDEALRNMPERTACPPRPSLVRAPGTDVVVAAAPKKVTAYYRTALDKTRGVIMNDRLLVHEKNCPRLMYTLRQPLDDLLRSPVMKGLVWVISALETVRAYDDPDEDLLGPWYANFGRNR